MKFLKWGRQREFDPVMKFSLPWARAPWPLLRLSPVTWAQAHVQAWGRSGLCSTGWWADKGSFPLFSYYLSDKASFYKLEDKADKWIFGRITWKLCLSEHELGSWQLLPSSTTKWQLLEMFHCHKLDFSQHWLWQHGCLLWNKTLNWCFATFLLKTSEKIKWSKDNDGFCGKTVFWYTGAY